MKRMVSVVPLLLVVGLILPGCSQGQMNEPKAQTKTAQLEITFDPSPAAYNDEGYWFWKIILSEYNGIGVKLTNFYREYPGGSHSYAENTESTIEDVCGLDYLPPWGTIYFSFWYPYVHIGYETYTFTGIDDRGNEVTVQRKLSILRPEEKAAKVTLDFNPNPLKENGTWQAVLSENKGVEVQLKSLTKCSYDKNSKLVEIEKSQTSLVEQYFSSSYLSPSSSLVSQERSRPSPEISYENLIITGEDNQGHLITVSGKIYYGETAEAEIIFEPNPVPCKDKRWSWETILKENNGVGIKIITSAKEEFGDKGIGVGNHDTSSVEEWHGYGSAYIPPHGFLSWGDWSPYRPGANYVKLIFTGIDDNGHKLTITGKVNLLAP